MKTWFRFALPLLSATSVVLLAGNAAAAATPQAGTSTAPPIVSSGLPPAAASLLQAEVARQIAGYGGVQVSPYEVAYDGGAAIMVFANPLTGEFPTASADRAESAAAPLTTSYRYGCPYTGSSGWTCFYQNKNFNAYSCAGGTTPPCTDGGRLLQFQSCGTQSLATYGFSDQTSSWVNNTSSYVSVYDSSGNGLWAESPGAASAYVGNADNDRADNFWIIC
jgi:hypothetical protein